MYLILIIKYEIGKKIFNDKNEHSLLQGHTIMNSPNDNFTQSQRSDSARVGKQKFNAIWAIKQ